MRKLSHRAIEGRLIKVFTNININLSIYLFINGSVPFVNYSIVCSILI